MKHTFNFKHISTLNSTSLNSDERYCLIAREIIRNAQEHGASKVELFTMSYNNKKYIHIAHDAKPFDSLEYLKDCLRPSTSGDNTGVQGSGMKLAMFLGADKDNAEVIVHSRNEDDCFSARLSCDDLNNAEIEEYSKFNEYIKKFYGKHYKKYNCFVSYRIQENKTIYTPKNISLLLDLIPVNDMDVFYIPFTTIGDAVGCKVKTYEEAISDSGIRRKKYYKPFEITKNFVIDSETFYVDNIEHPKTKRKFNALIKLEVYPLIYNKHSDLIILDKDSPNYGKSAGEDIDISNQTLFVNYDQNMIQKRATTGKKINRIFNDPIFTSLHVHGLLSILGMSCPKNKDFKSKIYQYSYISDFDDSIKDSIKNWSPMVKVRFTICDNDEISDLKLHDIISHFGGINEFFYCEDNNFIREILEVSFNKLAEKNPDNLKSFRNRIKKHFPFDEDAKLPLPVEEVTVSNNIQLFKKNKNGEYEKVANVNPGHVERNILARFSDGSPVLEDIDSTDRGFKLDRKGKNVFDFFVDELSMVDENGDIVPVSEEEYRHSPNFFPKSNCYVEIGKEKYRLGLKCNNQNQIKQVLEEKIELYLEKEILSIIDISVDRRESTEDTILAMDF